jgi:hypothetical protein
MSYRNVFYNVQYSKHEEDMIEKMNMEIIK